MTDTRAATGPVTAKLRAPQLPAGLVVRPRLLERLDASAARLVLISAPAGFGKTVLTLSWLKRQAPPHAWLSIDPLDNDPRRFLQHLGAAVAALDTPAAARAAAALAAAVATPEAPPAAELLDALSALDPRAVIVLDDLHEIEAGPVLGFVQALLDGLDGGPRLALLTRVDPALALGRLRVEGRLLELRERDLRFTRDEAAEFFRRVLTHDLDADLVLRLDERTEGWAAGLRMAAIALQRADEPRAVVDSFTGSHRFVVDYLVEEAVGRQSEAVQRFLMDTSVLERFTEGTCVAVTGDAGARSRLSEVEAANLFVVPLGEDRRWYRYHHLFAELLRFRLRRLHPDRAELLHERASRWFEAEGDVHQALEHAARMTDRTRLAELLDRHAFAMLGRSETANLRRWMHLVPEPLEQPFPSFLAMLAWLRILTERAPDLEALLGAVGSALARVPADYAPDRRQFAQAQLQVLRAFEARFAGRLEEAMEIGLRTLEQLPEAAAQPRGVLLYNQARIHMLLGEMVPAGELLERSFEQNLRARNLYLALTSLALSAAVRVQAQGVAPAAEALHAAVRFVEERQMSRLPVFASVLFQLAHVALLADELDQADAWLARALEVGSAGSLPEARANGLVAGARIRAAQGRFDEAESMLAELAALTHAHNALLLDTTLELERARLALLQGRPVAAPPAAEPDGGRWTVLREAASLVALHAAIREPDTDPAAALALAARLRREAEPRGRGIAVCVARLAEALLTASDQRWAMLDEALAPAAARGYLRPLLDLGEPVRALLQASLARSLSPPARAHARLLLDRFDAHTATRSPAPVAAALVDPLTDREREVLHHLLSGLSNKAIARAMHVSAETVKTHLKHVYAKLGVGSRRDAVARARAHGLDGPPHD